MLKSLSLAGLRVSLALLLIIWGLVRLAAPEAGMGVSSKYYGGLGANLMIQTLWGSALVLIGILCLVGWQRRFALPAQAVVLVTGALAIWKFIPRRRRISQIRKCCGSSMAKIPRVRKMPGTRM